MAEELTKNGKDSVEYVEHVPHYAERKRLPTRIPEVQLPYIPAEEVVDAGSRRDGTLWLVIDGVVYDCSQFAGSHPGGRAIIEGFAGQDCSWQFWTFHSRDILEKHAKPLRIGKTTGVHNKHDRPDRSLKKRPHRGVTQLNIEAW